ncbi:cytosolic protein [Bifidobacterium sp. DSM 109958]|uniref:Putative membrane protein insertion efficiency factor n=1 Tax=Bifidobacterium moraviense TaxID=2675323 RepID=A0A7Y0HY79_9BIFI|nr:membrane protein insertion efficiency factor YidD [Bifidobacterium sp. DSM 109958]NMN01011.1 cytosolic protein [Bifidobacterium sp. DSM 109958]
MTSLPGRIMTAAIRGYQRWISPLSPPRCRYYPTCSAYAVTAIRRFGALRGGVLAALRIARCWPWNPGGIDDVPRRFSLFYRFTWSKAHEEPRVTPAAWDSPESKE